MLPLLALIVVAGLVMASRSGAPAPHAIPAPASANLRALPAGSIVMIQGVSEAIVIVTGHVIREGDDAAAKGKTFLPGFDPSEAFQKVGDTLYFGHSMISGTNIFFTSDEIVAVQFVSPASVFVDQPL
jgi:hypothetical protein